MTSEKNTYIPALSGSEIPTNPKNLFTLNQKQCLYVHIYLSKIAKHFLEVTVYHKSISNFCKVNQNKVSFCGKIGSIILMDYTRSISCMLQIAVLQNHLRGIYTILPTIKIT